jgi:LytS/YehU family sensor histidine kinase
VLYLGYWVILIRKMVYGLSTDISSYAGQLFYVVTSLHFVMAIIVISSLYNAHVHKIELQLSHAQSLATETRLKNLQQQVDPHFLFNSLNILTALIPLDPEKAISFTQRLGEMYRFVLRSQEEDLVPLSQELQFAQDYYYLLSCRYQHSLFLHVDNQSQLHMHDLFIMPFTLQLLIENAVKHNVGEADRPLHMTIRIRNQSIVVENNLQFKHGNQGHGFGLRNLQERYRLLSQQAVRVQKEKDQFSVEVPLMKRLKTSA